MKGWIYKIIQIRNDEIPWMNGMCYVGQHRNSPLKKRWDKHKNDAKNYDPAKKRVEANLQNSIKQCTILVELIILN